MKAFWTPCIDSPRLAEVVFADDARDLEKAVLVFLDGAQRTKVYAGAYYISDAAIADLKAALAKCNDCALVHKE